MDNASDFSAENSPIAGLIASLGVPYVPEGEITDRYLNQAIGACCTEDGRVRLSKPVRNLIDSYAPADRPTMNWIPQERRRQFLNDLTLITKRALPPQERASARPSSPTQVPTQPESPLHTKAPTDAQSPTPPELPNWNGPVQPAGAPISADPQLAAQDANLISNGYEPIAVSGKAPVAKGWNTRPNTIEAVATERAHHPGSRSTGLRTGRLVGVDVDIIPAEHVQAIKRLSMEVLGFTLLERVGAKGAMLCYRNETAVGKITVSGKHPSKPGKIEILGAGQQFVSYGIHPDTGRPYTWTNAAVGGEPVRTPLDTLPEVTPEKLRDFAERAAGLLRELGYTDVKVSGRSETAEKEQFEPSADFEADTPLNIERARSWLRSLVDQGDVAVEGQGGDMQTYQVACRLRDFGLAPQTALDLLLEPSGWNEHCRPPWDRDELALKVRNAYKYGKNPPGADAVSFSPLELPASDASGAASSESANKLVERFRGRWPDEYEALPELNFWDDDKTLPRSPDGCIAIVYGEFGAHKTNTVLAMVLDAVFEADARVCYAAGEGAHGVGKQRIPAHCKARGITTKDLRGRLRIVPAVPLFVSGDQVTAFIEAQKDFAPNIVVLDTLATALAGEDENSSKAAAFLTANGPAGRIRDAFNALVILPAHQGKDAGKRVRGHSGFMGNADVVLHVEADKAAGAIKITVEKMRDGRDGFSIFFKVQPAGSEMVPVPERITKEEYLGLVGNTGTTGERPSEAQLTFNCRRDMLVGHGAVSFDQGLSELQFAEVLAGERPRDDDKEALAHWKAEVERARTSLKNAHGKPSYKGVLCAEQVPAGFDKKQWRWFIINPAPPDTAAGLDSAALAHPATLFGNTDHSNGMQSHVGASATGYPS